MRCNYTAYLQVLEGCVEYFARISYVYPLFLVSLMYTLDSHAVIGLNLYRGHNRGRRPYVLGSARTYDMGQFFYF